MAWKDKKKSIINKENLTQIENLIQSLCLSYDLWDIYAGKIEEAELTTVMSSINMEDCWLKMKMKMTKGWVK